MGSTAARFSVKSNKQLESGLVVDVVAIEYGTNTDVWREPFVFWRRG